jgi:hypothetical protein
MHRARVARASGFDDVGTFSFRRILPFCYVCFLVAYNARLALYAKIKHYFQNGNIRRKLKVPTSVISSRSKVQYGTGSGPDGTKPLPRDARDATSTAAASVGTGCPLTGEL